MLQAHRLCILLIITFIFFGQGCNNTEKPRLREKLKAADVKLQTLRTENQSLKAAYSQLQDRYDALETEHANLKAKNDDLTDWAQQLAEKFDPAVWYFGNDERPLPYKSVKNATAKLLVKELNSLFKTSGLPQVNLTKTANKIAYVKIIGDRQLTQEMGTTGATGYIEVVTYTLTSLPAINSVEFDFKEGDHAIPGRYMR